MAFLVNRNPAARFQCLHSLCKFINHKFNASQSFTMREVKFDAATPNIKSFCNYLTNDKSLGIRYCRYKSALDGAGCSLTNSVETDTTKSKEVSNTINSLHGLGLVTRDESNNITLTPLGKEFAETDFNSEQMHLIIVKATLNYGPMIGLLGQIIQNNSKEFDTADLRVGYPVTQEKIIFNENRITISSGSEQDSNTRTKSALMAWGVSAGFFKPATLPTYEVNKSHIGSSEYVLSKVRSQRKYVVLDLPIIFLKNFLVKRSLDYNNLTKNSKALRENNQADVRAATMQSDEIIKNRRFAILMLLNKAFKDKGSITIDQIVDFLKLKPDLYVLNLSELKKIVSIELEIANCAGIILEKNGLELTPLTGLHLPELQRGAPGLVLTDIRTRTLK
jgi:hypothetical protein